MRIKALPLLSAAVAVAATGSLAFAAPGIMEATNAPQVSAEERVSYVEPVEAIDLPSGDEISYSTPKPSVTAKSKDKAEVEEIVESKPMISSKPAPPKPKPKPKQTKKAVAQPTASASPTLPGTKFPVVKKAKPTTQPVAAAPKPVATQKAAAAPAAPKAAPARDAVAQQPKATAAPAKAKPAPTQAAPKPAPTQAAVVTGSPKAYAKSKVLARGWSEADYQCLVKLWTKESNWNYRAQNPSSGAYGIPQALPGGKMATAGSDWKTNPQTQIDWGLGYISQRYGNPCAAWGHSQRVNWY